MNKQEKQYVNAAGRFAAVVKAPGNGWWGETNSGNQFIRVPLIIADEGDQKGREIVWQGYLSEKAEERTMKTLNDIFGTNWTFDGLFTGKVTSWPGTPVSVTVAEEEYNGEPRFRAKWINPAVKKADVEVDEVAVWDRKLAEIRGSVPAAAEKTTTEEGDEIPF